MGYSSWDRKESDTTVLTLHIDSLLHYSTLMSLEWYLAMILICISLIINEVFPVAQTVKNLPAVQETWVQFLDQEDPLEKGMAIFSSILAWRISWTEKPGGLYSLWGCKKSDRTERLTRTHTHNLLFLLSFCCLCSDFPRLIR